MTSIRSFLKGVGGSVPSAFYPYQFADGRLGLSPARWVDPWARDDGKGERLVLSASEFAERGDMRRHYSSWLVRRGLKNMNHRFQVIQVMTSHHSEFSRFQWWNRYQDCLFTAWVTPQTVYCNYTKAHKQWYVVCPEDSEMVLRFELKEKGNPAPPRSAAKGEKWVSRIKAINQALIIPVECCRHFRHETTKGEIPANI